MEQFKHIIMFHVTQDTSVTALVTLGQRDLTVLMILQSEALLGTTIPNLFHMALPSVLGDVVSLRKLSANLLDLCSPVLLCQFLTDAPDAPIKLRSYSN